MAIVENPNERVLGANNLVVTSTIEEAYYSVTVKYFNRSTISATMPGDYMAAEVNGAFSFEIPQLEDLTSFYTTKSVEGNNSTNPDDYEGLVQSTQITIVLTKDTVINVLYFYIA